MNIHEEVDLLDCPLCQGPAILEEENGWCFWVSCMDCGAHTAEAAYKDESERLEAAKKAAALWNRGKVLSSHPCE